MGFGVASKNATLRWWVRPQAPSRAHREARWQLPQSPTDSAASAGKQRYDHIVGGSRWTGNLMVPTTAVGYRPHLGDSASASALPSMCSRSPMGAPQSAQLDPLP